MQQNSAVSSAPDEAIRPASKSHRWDKKIASVGFGLALLLAIICFATLMNANQHAKAQIEDSSTSSER